MNGEKLAIPKALVDHPKLLKELEGCLADKVEHFVCHYCGDPFSYSKANTECFQNNSSLNISEFKGFCAVSPDSSKWANRRHYFGTPLNPILFFSKAYLEPNSFTVYLGGLFLKVKTLGKVTGVLLSGKLKAADKKASGFLDLISMQYCLKEACKLT